MVGRLICRVITLDLGVFGERTLKVEFIHTPAEKPCVEYPLGADEDFEIFSVMHLDEDGEHEELNIWKLFVGNDSAYAELISAIKETRKMTPGAACFDLVAIDSGNLHATDHPEISGA